MADKTTTVTLVNPDGLALGLGGKVDLDPATGKVKLDQMPTGTTLKGDKGDKGDPGNDGKDGSGGVTFTLNADKTYTLTDNQGNSYILATPEFVTAAIQAAIDANNGGNTGTPGYTLTYDAIAARGLSDQSKPLTWMQNNPGVKMIFSEFGWPSNFAHEVAKYDANYDKAGTAWLETLKSLGVPWLIWGSAEWQQDLRAFASGNLSYGELTQSSNVAAVLKPYLAAHVLNGVNLSGGEYGVTPSGLGTVPGVLGTDYVYVSNASLDYLKAQGVKTIRLPFAWERAQRAIGGALDNTFVTNIQRLLDHASANGQTLILDCHNYGKYTPTSGAAPYKLGLTFPSAINGIGTMNAALVDLWQKIANQWGSHAGLNGYGIMNEPVGLSSDGNGNDTGGSIWRSASSDVANMLYATTGTNKNIYVSGYFYATSVQWTDFNGQTPWLYNYPAGLSHSLSYEPNVYFEAHMYLDDPDGGIYSVSYADNLTRAQNAGFTSGSMPIAGTGSYAPSAT